MTGNDKFSAILSTSFKKIDGLNDLPVNCPYLVLSLVLSWANFNNSNCYCSVITIISIYMNYDKN